MRALVYKNRRGVHFVADYPPPEPKAGEALIRVRLAGICNTDIEIARGYMGFEGVLGHEFVGEIAYAEDNELIGARVVGEINCPCKKCATCRAGHPNHCPNRTVLGIFGREGCFADLISLPRENLHPVPDGISDEAAVFVEPLAAACRILEQIRPRRNETIAVLGDGKLGLLAAMVLSLKHKDRVFAIGHNKGKLGLLKKYRVHGLLEKKAGKEKFDYVVDCTGNADGFRKAMELTKPCGTIVLKSTFASARQMNLAPLVVDEITVVGSRCGPFEAALKLLEKKKVKPEAMISEVFDIEQGAGAMKFALEKDAVKVLMRLR